jgi:hypothetical protein
MAEIVCEPGGGGERGMVLTTRVQDQPMSGLPDEPGELRPSRSFFRGRLPRSVSIAVSVAFFVLGLFPAPIAISVLGRFFYARHAAFLDQTTGFALFTFGALTAPLGAAYWCLIGTGLMKIARRGQFRRFWYLSLAAVVFFAAVSILVAMGVALTEGLFSPAALIASMLLTSAAVMALALGNGSPTAE